MLTHNTAWGSGTFFRAFGMAQALVRRGNAVTLLASGRARKRRIVHDRCGGVEIVQPAGILPFRIRHGGLSPFDLVSRLRWLSARDFDLIHGFEHRPAVLIPSLVTRKRKAIPYVRDWADLWGWPGIASQRSLMGKVILGLPDSFFERKVHDWVDGASVVNHSLRQRLISGGLRPELIEVVPPGSGPQLPELIPADQARADLDVPAGVPVLACVGISHYDDSFLILVWDRLKTLLPDAVCLVAGEPGRRMLRALEVDLRSGKVRNFGMLRQERVHTVLSAADALLLPFTNRGVNLGRFPNRIGDYLTAGRAIVTNATGDLGALVRTQRAGLALEDDPSSFAQALADLLDDKRRRASFGTRARALAEGEMNWDAHAGRLERLYERVIEVRAEEHAGTAA